MSYVKVEVGDTFVADRPLFGKTIHTCIRIKEGSEYDGFYNGWLVVEDNIMLPPKCVSSIIKKAEK